MQKTVDIDENSQFCKDLENLGYSQPVNLDLPTAVWSCKSIVAAGFVHERR